MKSKIVTDFKGLKLFTVKLCYRGINPTKIVHSTFVKLGINTTTRFFKERQDDDGFSTKLVGRNDFFVEAINHGKKAVVLLNYWDTEESGKTARHSPSVPGFGNPVKLASWKWVCTPPVVVSGEGQILWGLGDDDFVIVRCGGTSTDFEYMILVGWSTKYFPRRDKISKLICHGKRIRTTGSGKEIIETRSRW